MYYILINKPHIKSRDCHDTLVVKIVQGFIKVVGFSFMVWMSSQRRERREGVKGIKQLQKINDLK